MRLNVGSVCTALQTYKGKLRTIMNQKIYYILTITELKMWEGRHFPLKSEALG